MGSSPSTGLRALERPRVTRRPVPVSWEPLQPWDPHLENTAQEFRGLQRPFRSRR